MVADFAASAIADAAPNRKVLGTTGSAPWNEIRPPMSSGRTPMSPSSSESAACGSKTSSVAGLATAFARRSVSDILVPFQQFHRDQHVLCPQVFADRLADLVD